MKNSTIPSSPLLRETLRQRYPNLGDENLEFAPGEEEKFLDHLRQHTGESRETLAILLRSMGVNIPPPWRPVWAESAGSGDGDGNGNGNASQDVDHSRGSGIPDDTSRSGGRSM